MANTDRKKKKILPSVLDRLIDFEPETKVEAEQNKHQLLQDLRTSVKRDLENLMNTRYRIVSPPEELSELEVCILNYGLPDLATVNISALEKRKAFTRHLESLLKSYEPRFKNVTITYQDNDGDSDRTLRFRIDAVLYADPVPEVIVFDSILEPVSRTVNVQASHHV